MAFYTAVSKRKFQGFALILDTLFVDTLLVLADKFPRLQKKGLKSDRNPHGSHLWSLSNHLTVRPNGITDTEKYFRINYAFPSRYRYRRNLVLNNFW